MHLAVIRIGGDEYHVEHTFSIAQRQGDQPVALAHGVAVPVLNRGDADQVGRLCRHTVDADIFIVAHLLELRIPLPQPRDEFVRRLIK